MARGLESFADAARRSGARGMVFQFIRIILDAFCVTYGTIRYSLILLQSDRTSERVRRSVNGYEMILRKKASGIHRELLLHGAREHFSTEYMAGTIRNDDILLEIGANIGYYALLEGKRATEGRIFALEPVPETLDLLRENINLNHLSNISVHEIALGDCQGTMSMFVSKRCNWSSLIDGHLDEVVYKLDVKVMTLDDFVELVLRRSPSFVRMDVEGYEAAVLRGATNYLAQSVESRLFIEIHPSLLPRGDIADLIGRLKCNGYKVEAIFREFNPVYRRWLAPLYNLIDKLDGGTGYGNLGDDYSDLERALGGGTTHVFFSK